MSGVKHKVSGVFLLSLKEDLSSGFEFLKDELREVIAVYCEDNDIRTYHVDIEATLAQVKVAVVLVFNKEKEE